MCSGDGSVCECSLLGARDRRGRSRHPVHAPANVLLHHVGKPSVGERIPRDTDDLVLGVRFIREDYSGQPSDIVGGGYGQAVVPTAKRMDLAVFEIDHAEGRFEQEAGEHSRRNDNPLRSGLPPQHVAYVRLLIEHLLAAAPATTS